MSESPAEGWPPIHAVDLLADLRAPEAIEPMLDLLVDTTLDEVINSRLLVRLPEFGAAALEPAVEPADAATTRRETTQRRKSKQSSTYFGVCWVKSAQRWQATSTTSTPRRRPTTAPQRCFTGTRRC